MFILPWCIQAWPWFIIAILGVFSGVRYVHRDRVPIAGLVVVLNSPYTCNPPPLLFSVRLYGVTDIFLSPLWDNFWSDRLDQWRHLLRPFCLQIFGLPLPGSVQNLSACPIVPVRYMLAVLRRSVGDSVLCVPMNMDERTAVWSTQLVLGGGGGRGRLTAGSNGQHCNKCDICPCPMFPPPITMITTCSMSKSCVKWTPCSWRKSFSCFDFLFDMFEGFQVWLPVQECNPNSGYSHECTKYWQFVFLFYMSGAPGNFGTQISVDVARPLLGGRVGGGIIHVDIHSTIRAVSIGGSSSILAVPTHVVGPTHSQIQTRICVWSDWYLWNFYWLPLGMLKARLSFMHLGIDQHLHVWFTILGPYQ